MVVLLGSIGNEMPLVFKDGKMLATDKQWYDLPMPYSFRANSRQEVIDRLTRDVNRYFDAIEKEDAQR